MIGASLFSASELGIVTLYQLVADLVGLVFREAEHCLEHSLCEGMVLLAIICHPDDDIRHFY